MNLSREDLIILAASNLYASCPAITDVPHAVKKALEIEVEVQRQRKAQDGTIPRKYKAVDGPTFDRGPGC